MQRGIVGAAIAIAACGGSGKPPATGPSNHAGPRSGPARAIVDADAICDRIAELRAAGCAGFGDYDLAHDECVADVDRSLDARGDDAHDAVVAWGTCVVEQPSCAEVSACIGRIATIDAGFRDCADTSSSAVVGRPVAEWNRRRGAGAVRFSDVTSTADQPIEVCHIDAEMEWLLRMVCDDGSHPFATDDHAHAARVGNVGAGGACGSIIDLYEVPCPEATYEVFMDAYVCPLPDP